MVVRKYLRRKLYKKNIRNKYLSTMIQWLARICIVMGLNPSVPRNKPITEVQNSYLRVEITSREGTYFQPTQISRSPSVLIGTDRDGCRRPEGIPNTREKSRPGCRRPGRHTEYTKKVPTRPTRLLVHTSECETNKISPFASFAAVGDIWITLA